ncbi:MAG TPA: hypothetical protein VFK13_07070 [Gemmatimonadaceae bacterium]|nr:hypothetical protein [Gemmatimonadaceae bacterium]
MPFNRHALVNAALDADAPATAALADFEAKAQTAADLSAQVTADTAALEGLRSAAVTATANGDADAATKRAAYQTAVDALPLTRDAAALADSNALDADAALAQLEVPIMNTVFTDEVDGINADVAALSARVASVWQLRRTYSQRFTRARYGDGASNPLHANNVMQSLTPLAGAVFRYLRDQAGV